MGMSKMLKALQKASEERSGVVSPVEESKKGLVNNMGREKMRKSWVTWSFFIAVVASVFFAFNYGGNNDVPLSSIFPDEQEFPVDVEYEFVEDENISGEAQEAVSEDAAALATTPASLENANPAVDNNTVLDKEFNYTVQIASFKDRKKAESALEKIQGKVASAYISSQDLGAKGVWYRVYAGQFELKSAAEVALIDIKKSYDSSFIISPKKSK